MQEQWDFYFCRVDDAPASIYLNLALAQTAPLEECAVMAWVSLEMRAPREDGFSSAEEYPVLEQSNLLKTMLDNKERQVEQLQNLSNQQIEQVLNCLFHKQTSELKNLPNLSPVEWYL
ncbi:DUF695 domain-containing protein, partial [Undibacterium luofuense]|uniref:DUF695 domain-containing protein n=1 Tax=Undibacterium luofuense TaxID=2828733 RepID=UPI0030EE2C49